MTGRPAANPSGSTARHKILVVDDEPQLLTVLQCALTAQGYEVVVASDGMAGLNLARTQPFALIILDLHLPRLDGHAVCKMLKSDQRYQQLPVVMLTASIDPEDREWAARSGADAFVTKPFDLQEIGRTVQALLAKRESGSQ